MSAPIRYDPNYHRAAQWSNPTDAFAARMLHAARMNLPTVLLSMTLTVVTLAVLFGAVGYHNLMAAHDTWTRQAPCMAATKHLLDLNAGVNATEGKPGMAAAHEHYEEGLVQQTDVLASACGPEVTP